MLYSFHALFYAFADSLHPFSVFSPLHPPLDTVGLLPTHTRALVLSLLQLLCILSSIHSSIPSLMQNTWQVHSLCFLLAFSALILHVINSLPPTSEAQWSYMPTSL